MSTSLFPFDSVLSAPDQFSKNVKTILCIQSSLSICRELVPGTPADTKICGCCPYIKSPCIRNTVCPLCLWGSYWRIPRASCIARYTASYCGASQMNKARPLLFWSLRPDMIKHLWDSADCNQFCKRKLSSMQWKSAGCDDLCAGSWESFGLLLKGLNPCLVVEEVKLEEHIPERGEEIKDPGLRKKGVLWE